MCGRLRFDFVPHLPSTSNYSGDLSRELRNQLRRVPTWSEPAVRCRHIQMQIVLWRAFPTNVELRLGDPMRSIITWQGVWRSAVLMAVSFGLAFVGSAAVTLVTGPRNDRWDLVVAVCAAAVGAARALRHGKLRDTIL